MQDPPQAKTKPYLCLQCRVMVTRCCGRWTYVGQTNRPFYRYGGHIELIRFKEYYRMPRGHELISFVFSSAFRDIFSLSFLRIRL